jgi:predicted CXXCH cytochrome family protein
VVRAQLEAAIAHPASVPTIDVPAAAPQDDDPDRRRPGEVAPRGAGLEVLSSVDGIFETRICAKCHEVDPGPPKTVSAPHLRESWMVRARFTHQPHRAIDCQSCHAAKDSTDSDQLVLPQIDTCRTCHTTADSIRSVQTPCVDCHRFHQAREAVMGPTILKGVRAHGAPQRDPP